MSSEGSFCPSCGGTGVVDDVCPECEFSFATVLKCPFLDDEGVCNKKETKCSVDKGISFEICEIMREF